MQLKAKIKDIARDNNIPAQVELQNFILERFLERISISPYKKNFVIKGGFLIAAIFGLNSRATMDLDTTVKRFPVNEKTIRKSIDDICSIEIEDNINFILKRIEEIRERDNYKGIRVSIDAHYNPMKIPIKIDITTGDRITPNEIEFYYPLMFENRKIKILAYNLETILAEKIETIISRGDLNTRMRDFYDVYIIHKFQWVNIDKKILINAMKSTFKKRNTLDLFSNHFEIMESIKENNDIYRNWLNYQDKYRYALGISFEDLLNSIDFIFEELSL